MLIIVLFLSVILIQITSWEGKKKLCNGVSGLISHPVRAFICCCYRKSTKQKGNNLPCGVINMGLMAKAT